MERVLIRPVIPQPLATFVNYTKRIVATVIATIAQPLAAHSPCSLDPSVAICPPLFLCPSQPHPSSIVVATISLLCSHCHPLPAYSRPSTYEEGCSLATIVTTTYLYIASSPSSVVAIALYWQSAAYSPLCHRCRLSSPRGIGKLVENTLRDHQRKTVRLATRVPEAVGLTGVQDGIEKVKGITFSSFSTIIGGTPKILGNMWQLYYPSRRLYRSYPDFRGAFGDCTAGTGGCTTHTQIF
ncbi:hypothetical protein BHM03_00011052 [Ensete ventricosum]|nr:hypothetical protein BHM03_00011052 [Ensete ventricosum]